MRHRVVILCLAASLLSARADEEKVPLSKVPKAVLDAVKKKYPRGTLGDAYKMTEDKKVTYDVKVKDGDQEVAVIVSPDGTVLIVAKEVPVEKLPKAVTAALEKKYPKATLKSAEEVTKDKERSYEVIVVTAAKKTFEVTLDPKGKILDAQEIKDDKE